MTKQRLAEMLGRLPIYNPKVGGVRDLFPHLTPDEISAIIGSEGKTIYVAVPPLRVNGAYQVVLFSPEKKGDDQNNRPFLNWAYAGRTVESYSNQICPNTSHLSLPPYTERAIGYARDNWGSDLVLDDWADCVEIKIRDPADLTENYTPKTVAVVWFTTTRPWNDIYNDRSRPPSELINRAIAEITTNHFIRAEIQGRRGLYFGYSNCRYDGGGLDLTKCYECGRNFLYLSYGWYTPLPKKITDHLIAEGFQFEEDPEIARQREAERFYGQHRK